MKEFIPVAAFLLATLIVFLVYVFIRNRIDEKRMEQQMNKDYPKYKRHSLEKGSKV